MGPALPTRARRVQRVRLCNAALYLPPSAAPSSAREIPLPHGSREASPGRCSKDRLAIKRRLPAPTRLLKGPPPGWHRSSERYASAGAQLLGCSCLESCCPGTSFMPSLGQNIKRLRAETGAEPGWIPLCMSRPPGTGPREVLTSLRRLPSRGQPRPSDRAPIPVGHMWH